MRNRNAEALVVLGGILLAALALAQEKRSGWELKPGNSYGKLHLRLETYRPGHHSVHGSDVPMERFRGLAQDIFDRGGAVKFEYVHDAGRLLCQGRFSWSRGSGTFTFVPDPQFSVELNRLGYDAPDHDQLFHMMMSDIGLDFARGIREAGLHASTRQLIDLRNHGVKLEYIRKIQEAGYRNLGVHEFIQLRNHGVTAEFAKDLKVAGYELDAREVVNLRNHGVSSQYLADLKNYGLRPSASDMVQLRNHGVTPAYLNSLEQAGYSGLTANEITNLRNHGVPIEFVQTAKDLGYNFHPRELVEMRNHGVDGKYLQRLRDSGMKNLNASQIARLKMHGVD